MDLRYDLLSKPIDGLRSIDRRPVEFIDEANSSV
jgi:hypothetical protein